MHIIDRSSQINRKIAKYAAQWEPQNANKQEDE